MSLLKRIRKRYLLALLLIATLVTVFTGLVQFSIRAQQQDARLINIAGMQRMLSQKIALHVHQLSQDQITNTQGNSLNRALNAAAERFLQNHIYLTKGRELSPKLTELYFANDNKNLDSRVLAYVEAAKQVTKQQALTNQQRALFSPAYTNKLLPDLDTVVRQIEHEAQQRVAAVAKIELALWILTLIMLVGEVFVIFRPMEKIIASNIESLRQQQKQAKKLLKKVENASAAKNEFLANMSHELRTPLNGIIGMIDQLHESQVNPAQAEQLAIANTSARSLLKMINEILDVCNIDTGISQLENTTFNLKHLLKEVCEGFNYEAQSKQLEFLIDIQHLENSLVISSPRHIRQVLYHLLSNAFKFTHEGRVSFRANMGKEHQLSIKIEDSGIGINKEHKDKIFDIFTQGDASSSRKYEGAGLGLSISKQFVELLNGSLEIHSEAGQGTTCLLTLPLRLPNETVAISTHHNYENQTALIVEDNLVNKMVLEAIIKQFGFTVQWAEDGQKALDLLNKQDHAFNIILMDCRMPNMDGYEATKAIRKGEGGLQHVETPIIAVTANALSGDKQKCLSCGMDDYISKPVDKTLLKQVIDRTYSRLACD